VAPWEEVQREAEHDHEVRMYRARVMGVDPAELGRGSHSSTFQLNLSCF
jgi:hypothetical protein